AYAPRAGELSAIAWRSALAIICLFSELVVLVTLVQKAYAVSRPATRKVNDDMQSLFRRLHLTGGRWAAGGLLAVAAGATLIFSGVSAAGASPSAHASVHPITHIAPRPHRGTPAPDAAGNLINHGGPVQTAPAVWVVYWGWTSDPNGEQARVNSFLSDVGGSSWLSTVHQYSSAG